MQKNKYRTRYAEGSMATGMIEFSQQVAGAVMRSHFCAHRLRTGNDLSGWQVSGRRQPVSPKEVISAF